MPNSEKQNLYVAANRGLLNFDVIKAFPRSVLLNAGVPDIVVDLYASDKTKIPLAMRNAIVAEYTKALISKNPITGNPGYYNQITGKYEIIYNETNNYYRMLMGLPNKGETEYIYNTDPRWDTTTPIHELDKVSILEMEEIGIIDELQAKYPSKKYLSHLGRRKIDPFVARVAERFEILYHAECQSSTLNDDFINVYNSARRQVTSVYYNNRMNRTHALYENFMAMCILFMTIQGIQSNYLQVDITRDFYDTESLKLVYDSYGVPFYNEIPLEYHRKIVKNINRLISYKGSAQVFFDLFDIFDMGNMDIYSYYLTKVHKFNADGTPSLVLKTDSDGNTIYDSEGNPVLDESNFTIKFSKAKIYDDPALSMSDDTNNIDYSELTSPDPYWIDDGELTQKLSSENFNYLESKYIGIQTVFDLLKITYENAYIFRMIADNKNLTEKMEFRWSDTGITCSIFDLFIYLACLYCRFYGYEGLLNAKMPAVMDTLGYDFNNTFAKNRSNSVIQKNTRLMQLISNLSISNLITVNDCYDDITEIRDLIIEGYTNATNLDDYWLYRNLYNTLLVSKEVASVYSDSNTGEVYETFTDVLANSSPELMQRYLILDDSNLEDEITIAIAELENVITNLKYLTLSVGTGSSSMIESLFRILKFFKSAKAELVTYNILYTITMRGLNFFKTLDRIVLCKEQLPIGKSNFNILDLGKFGKETYSINHDSSLFLMSKLNEIHACALADEHDRLTDEMVVNVITTSYRGMDDSWSIDIMSRASDTTSLASVMPIQDIDTPILIKIEDIQARYIAPIHDTTNKLSDCIARANTTATNRDSSLVSDWLFERDRSGSLIRVS